MSTSQTDSDMLMTSSDDVARKKTFKSSFFITLPVFMGYACCFALQQKLSVNFGLTLGASGDKLSNTYGVATSFVYFFNLIFRVLGHNIVFGCLSPKWRVTTSLISMIIGMCFFIFVSNRKSNPVGLAFIPFAFCGVCEGSYGPNMLNVVNNMGNTRLYVVLAMPVGVSLITILGFFLMGFGVPYTVFYIVTAVCLLIAIILYHLTVFPEACRNSSGQHNFNLKDFGNDICNIGDWFPKIWFCSLVFLLNMVCLALFNPGCTLYTYQSRVTYRLLGFTIDNNFFMLAYNTCSFLGDFFSRKVMDKKRIINPVFYFILLCFGFAINISQIPEIVPFAAFCFSWANGGLYVQCTKLISMLFKEKYHLTATSTWLFIGDSGSTSGANIVQFLRPVIASIKQRMY